MRSSVFSGISSSRVACWEWPSGQISVIGERREASLGEFKMFCVSSLRLSVRFLVKFLINLLLDFFMWWLFLFFSKISSFLLLTSSGIS